MLISYFKGLWKDRYILSSLVNSDLQAKYRKSILGVAWAIITPLGLVLIIGAVYSIIFGSDPKTFIPMLFGGLTPWFFINSVADGGTGAFLAAEGYLKQTSVNAQIFPCKVALVGFVNLLYSILAFFTIYLFLQPQLFSAKMLMIFPGLFLLLIFGVSLSNISAILNLNIRDFQPLQSLIFQGIFYGTPIIFPAQILKEKGFEIIYKINPFYYMIEIVKEPMLGNEIPSLYIYLIAISITLLLYVISIFALMKTKKGIAFKL